MKTNKGKIDFNVAMKTLTGKVKGAGELTAMHVMAVLTLTGNCVKRDFLRRATLTELCKKQAMSSMFFNFDISPSQMKRTLDGVVRCCMGSSEFIVENLFCESVRKKQGFDTFHPSQTIMYLDEPTNNILCLIGGKRMSRTEEDDRWVLAKLPDEDRTVPLFPWWQAKSGILGIHDWYVQLCWKVLRVEPHSLVIRPHVNATKNERKEEVWNKYIRRLGIVKPDTNKPKKRKRRRQGRIVSN
jgi:hypothetical protein